MDTASVGIRWSAECKCWYVVVSWRENGVRRTVNRRAEPEYRPAWNAEVAAQVADYVKMALDEQYPF